MTLPDGARRWHWEGRMRWTLCWRERSLVLRYFSQSWMRAGRQAWMRTGPSPWMGSAVPRMGGLVAVIDRVIEGHPVRRGMNGEVNSPLGCSILGGCVTSLVIL